MGHLFGVQPDSCECGFLTDPEPDGKGHDPQCDITYRSLRTGATDDEVLWFHAHHRPSGLNCAADEIAPGVMSTQRARGEVGKTRITAKLLALVEEFT